MSGIAMIDSPHLQRGFPAMSVSQHAVLPRRSFLATAVGAPLIAAPLTGAAGSVRAAAGSRRTVGVVGLGSRGFNLIDDLLRQSDAQIVAVCDVDELHYRDLAWGKGKAFGRTPARRLIETQYARRGKGTAPRVSVYSDFRELCAHDDLDAVVVATPDHWHALIALTALGRGLDVYCEKPVTHLFAEGRTLYREAARRKAIVQVGSQQRSDARFRRAVEIVRNGHLGRIERVEVGLPSGYERPQGETRVVEPPEHLDYEMWCGPARKLPYMRARHHRWWRGHTAFGGGVLMDWIGHHNDIGHWGIAMDSRGPLRVEAVDWTFPQTPVYDTPHHYTIRCDYPGGIATTISDGNPIGTRWIGDEGWIHVRRGKWSASNSSWLEPKFDPGAWRLDPPTHHMRNFLDCMATRRPCHAPPETAHRSITPGHLAYVSWKLKRPLKWDAAGEQVVDDDEANRLLYRVDYRSPWSAEQIDKLR